MEKNKAKITLEIEGYKSDWTVVEPAKVVLSQNEVEIMKNLIAYNYSTAKENIEDNANILGCEFDVVAHNLGLSLSQAYGVIGSLCSKGLLMKLPVNESFVYYTTGLGVLVSFKLSEN
jgi:hypothetical protein